LLGRRLRSESAAAAFSGATRRPTRPRPCAALAAQFFIAAYFNLFTAEIAEVDPKKRGLAFMNRYFYAIFVAFRGKNPVWPQKFPTDI
jgi:hypothetical protein